MKFFNYSNILSIKGEMQLFSKEVNLSKRIEVFENMLLIRNGVLYGTNKKSLAHDCTVSIKTV